MSDLFDIVATDAHPVYVDMRDGQSEKELALRSALNKYWHVYAPFAPAGFREQFAHAPDIHFWEMYLAGELIGADKQLVKVSGRPANGQQPALCVKDGSRHIWIELTVPLHNTGPEQVQEQRFENEGGSIEEAPLHQAQRRITSALDAKNAEIRAHLKSGGISPDDVRLVAICGSYFGVDVPQESIRLVMSAVFPVVKESVQVDSETGEIVAPGAEPSSTIAKIEGQVSSKSEIADAYAHVSGVIWSNIGREDMSREHCPITFMHNPLAAVPLPEGWGAWDHELVVMERDANWDVLDILEPVPEHG